MDHPEDAVQLAVREAGGRASPRKTVSKTLPTQAMRGRDTGLGVQGVQQLIHPAALEQFKGEIAVWTAWLQKGI